MSITLQMVANQLGRTRRPFRALCAVDPRNGGPDPLVGRRARLPAHPHAPGPRTRRSNLIGVLVLRPSDVVLALIYEGIEEAAADHVPELVVRAPTAATPPR